MGSETTGILYFDRVVAKYCRDGELRRQLDRRRGRIEPLHEQLKRLFALEVRVWRRGLLNNQTQLVGAVQYLLEAL